MTTDAATISSPKPFLKPEKIIYPKKYADNIDYRIDIARKSDDSKFRALIAMQCRDDVKFFFNTFLWTFDPRPDAAPNNLPFITYDYEDDFIDWLLARIGRRDGLVEKSRDMGVTWTILGVFLHHWLFKDAFLAHLGSKTEDDVDRSGDPKSLFEKLRYFLKTIPAWLLTQHETRFMRLVNENGNTITGESANPNFARAGRYSVCLVDEYAAVEYADDIWTSMSNSTPSRIVASTPRGTGNRFWKLRYYEMPKEDIKTLHWTLHPKKSIGLYVDSEGTKKYSCKGKKRSPWYDMECERNSAQIIAQELDVDYLASGNPYFDLQAVSKQEEWILSDETAGLGKYEIGLLARVDGKIKFRPNRNGLIRIYEHPGPLTQATAVCDPAEGLEHGDKTAIAVRCKKTGNLLAACYGKIAPDEAGELVKMLSLYYNGALCGAEQGGYGLVINQFLWEEGCNVFRDVETRHGGEKEGKKLGFNTKRHRAEMLKLAEEEIRNDAVEIRDRDLKTEMLNFINKDGKAQAAQGACDDFIFAWSMAGMMANWYPYSRRVEQGVIGKQRSIYGSERESTPNMGFSFAGASRQRRF